jgi:hypothetical protein
MAKKDLDPQEITELPDYERPEEDPADDEVTDPSDPNYVVPGEEH